MESLQEMIGAARLRGVPEATIQAAIAPLREKANAVVAVVNAEAEVKALREQAAALVIQAEHQQQDLIAAEGRAAPLLAEAERLVAPYRDALAETARRRVELAERLEAAEAEEVKARAAEDRVFRTREVTA